MAKAQINDTEDIHVSHVENVEDNEATATKVVVAAPTKKVKIRATEMVDCIIANTHYRLTKDKEHSVPVDVAAILCHSGKAYKL